jgi:hypothetical protein
LFVHPKDVQDGKVELTAKDITTNLPYRPDIAMNEPALVRDVQGVGDSGEQVERPSRVERAVPRKQLAQVTAADEAHRQKQVAIGLAEVEDRDDVRVLKGRGQLRLPQETATEALVAGQLGVEQLERDTLIRAGALGEIDRTGSALADQRDQPIARHARPQRRVAPHPGRA